MWSQTRRVSRGSDKGLLDLTDVACAQNNCLSIAKQNRPLDRRMLGAAPAAHRYCSILTVLLNSSYAYWGLPT